MAPPGLSGGKVMSHAHVVMESGRQPDANAAADVNDKVTALFPQQDDEAVDSALELFNRMSRQITDSYRTLESRVNQLSGELSYESRQRQQELEEAGPGVRQVFFIYY